MDFENLVLATTINGLPALVNGGQQRFEGVELEGRWQLAADLSLAGSFASHSATFRDYVAEFDGVPTQLRGNRLEMSPDVLAALGLVYAPPRGFTAYATGNHVGSRYLDKRNHFLAGAYDTLAAGVGYRFEQLELRLDGDNLTDRRPPVAESELGDAQYYVLPSRSVEASVRFRFGRGAAR
jgi:outer membrane receptor protein involved in Fe transport